MCLDSALLGQGWIGMLTSACPVVRALTWFFLCALSDGVSKHFPQLFPDQESCSGLWSNWYPWGTDQRTARHRGEFSKGTSLSLCYLNASGRNVIPLRPLPICQTWDQPTGSKVIWGSNDWQYNCMSLGFFPEKPGKKSAGNIKSYFCALCSVCSMQNGLLLCFYWSFFDMSNAVILSSHQGSLCTTCHQRAVSLCTCKLDVCCIPSSMLLLPAGAAKSLGVLQQRAVSGTYCGEQENLRKSLIWGG